MESQLADWQTDAIDEEVEMYEMSAVARRNTEAAFQRTADKSTLLLVDNDIALCESLSKALAARGFEVRVAHSARQASRLVEDDPPQCAVIALKLADSSGLKLISALLAHDPHMRILVLTAYPSIRTAVEAIKLGAIDYLAKPSSAEEVIVALQRGRGDDGVAIGKKPMSIHRAEWEYINQVLR